MLLITKTVAVVEKSAAGLVSRRTTKKPSSSEKSPLGPPPEGLSILFSRPTRAAKSRSEKSWITQPNGSKLKSNCRQGFRWTRRWMHCTRLRIARFRYLPMPVLSKARPRRFEAFRISFEPIPPRRCPCWSRNFCYAKPIWPSNGMPARWSRFSSKNGSIARSKNARHGRPFWTPLTKVCSLSANVFAGKSPAMIWSG